MKKWIFVGVILLIYIVVAGGRSKKGAIWKSLFSLLQVGNISGNNGPGAR